MAKTVFGKYTASGLIERNVTVCPVTGRPVQAGDVRIDLPYKHFLIVNGAAWAIRDDEQRNALVDGWTEEIRAAMGTSNTEKRGDK